MTNDYDEPDKPCPECGGDAYCVEVEFPFGNAFFVNCTTCNLVGETTDDPKTAWDKWNEANP